MILSRKHPHLTMNEEGLGSEQVRYHPSKEFLRSQEFFYMMRFENRGKLENLDLPGLSN
jgi:hypothetical protein